MIPDSDTAARICAAFAVPPSIAWNYEGQPEHDSEPCATEDDVTGAVCTNRSGHLFRHADRSNPGCVITWAATTTERTS